MFKTEERVLQPLKEYPTFVENRDPIPATVTCSRVATAMVRVPIIMEDGRNLMMSVTAERYARLLSFMEVASHSVTPPRKFCGVPQTKRANGFRERPGIDTPRNKPFYRRGDKW